MGCKMNREEAKKLLPIIQAYAEGKQLQIQYKSEWKDVDDPSFTSPPGCYRIKPEPREWTLVLDVHDNIVGSAADLQSGCIRTASGMQSLLGCRTVKVREVLEDV